MTSTHFTGPTVCPDFDNPLGTKLLRRCNTASSTTPAGVESKDLILRLPLHPLQETTEVSPSLDFGKPPSSEGSSIKRPDSIQSHFANLATGQSKPSLLELIRNTSFQKDLKSYHTFCLLMAGGNFGALQLDYENQKWMRAHVIEVDGSLECGASDWQHMSDSSPVALDPREGMKAAARFGLCAGKLYVPSRLVKSRTPAAGFQCSGVTLERRYFMTVYRFREFGEESLTELMKPDGKAVSISIARSSKFSGKDLTIRKAFLRFFNKERDFALFQLDDESEDFPNSVYCSQLIATDHYDFYEHFAGKRVWSVGYMCEEDERYPKYWELLRQVVSHEKSQVIEDMHEVSPPKFEAIFHPNERVLLLGKIVSNPTSPHLWYHSIPGWFGISGSLIGYFTRNKRDELMPTIIGMFSGGEAAEEFNKLIPLTSDMLQQVRAIVGEEKSSG